MTGKLKAQIEQLKTQLGADRKKAAILGLLAIVLVVVVGRLIFSSSPAQTTAAIPTITLTPVAASPRQAAGDAGPAASASSTPRPLADREAPHDSLTEKRRVRVDGMPRELARDLFSTKAWNKFMPAALATAEDPFGGKKRRGRIGLWGQLRRSWSEYGRERQELMEAFHRDMEKLQLQSTLTGAEPLAHISGRLVRPGDDIEGFSVVRIADREVVIARGGLTATLTMK